MSGYKRVNFYELCRLCATNQQKEKTHIFQEEGRKIQLQNKIQSCLSLKVCENDFLPKVVCSQCLHSLEECSLFRKECYSSETMLSSYFNNFRYTDDFKKSGKVYIKDTTPKVSAPLTTTTCNTVATNSSYNISVVPPNSNCITQDPLPYYTLQLPTVVSQPQEPKIPPKELKAQPQIIYNLNTIKTATPSLLKDNSEQVGNITINSNGEIVTLAPYLDVNTMVSQTLNQKSRKLSKRPKSNLTEKIDIPTIDLTADLKYKEKFKSQPKINTKNVPLVNSSELNVLNPQSMILTHTPTSSTLNINRTPKFFSYSTNVDVITPENITNINPEPPPINVSTYNYAGAKQDTHTINTELYNQNQLANQQDYVATTGNQNYALVNGKQEIVVKHHSCDICGKMFKRREHLYQHMKLHTGFRPFVCENCNKSFLRKEHLLRHMIAHSGQKNYTCTICDKSFSRNDNLLKHKKIHSKQSSFTCEVCQKQFVMEHYYFAHKRTHENEKSSQMWGGLLKAI